MAFYYVDYENVHLSGLKGIEELNHKDEVYIYCRYSDIKRIETSVNKKDIKSKVKCIVVEGRTKNALDFELLSDFFVSRKHDLRIIVSKDKGYDAAIHNVTQIICSLVHKVRMTDQ